MLNNSLRKDNFNDGKPEKLLPAITNPNARLDFDSSFSESLVLSRYFKELVEKGQLQ